MKVGIIQSSYIPWRGYFDFIASVDVFVVFDDVSFGSKGSWRHRNQLKFMMTQISPRMSIYRLFTRSFVKSAPYISTTDNTCSIF